MGNPEKINGNFMGNQLGNQQESIGIFNEDQQSPGQTQEKSKEK